MLQRQTENYWRLPLEVCRLNDYWAERQAKIQDALTTKNQKKIEKQLAKYYASAAKQIIADFESVYNQVLAQAAEGK